MHKYTTDSYWVQIKLVLPRGNTEKRIDAFASLNLASSTSVFPRISRDCWLSPARG
jgi:hypothetical protein